MAPVGKNHGSSITYTLYYFNFGNASAHNVILEDKLPNIFNFVSASDGGVYDSSTRTIRWDIGVVNSSDQGYRILNVTIPQEVPAGTVIVNNANVSTSDPEVRYDDNKAQAQTKITGLDLPQGVDIEPNNGGIGIPSVYIMKPITFSYHTNKPVNGVVILIHVDDGSPDIVANMTNLSNNMTYWSYTITPYPRHGSAKVSYIELPDPAPYVQSYDVRNSYCSYVTADGIYNYIKTNYPQSPMLNESDIGNSFMNASETYGIDPLFLVGLAEEQSQFGTAGWAAEHPEAHNAFNYSVSDDYTSVDPYDYGAEGNSAFSWGDMVNRVAYSIVEGPYYFTQGYYTIDAICNAYDNQSTQNQNQLLKAAISTKGGSSRGKIGKSNGGKIGKSNGGKISPKRVTDNMNNYLKLESVDLELGIPGFVKVTCKFRVDPAGYIYDIDTGARIANASVWLQQPDGQGNWENVPTGENPPVSQPDTNPLTSDKDGGYHWDTFPGAYRVHVEAQEYEPGNSNVVAVPPPVTDLAIGLHHIYDPNVPPILPVANFSTNVNSGHSPLSVQLTDLSENSTGISWDFGDGASTTDRYPTHTYSTPGTYTIKLTASNGNGISSKTGTIKVQAVAIYPISNFSSNISKGHAPLTVQFRDSSVNAIEWNWNFGDGFNSTERNPIHTFLKAGNYTINLTVSNTYGTDTNISEVEVLPEIPYRVDLLIFLMAILYIRKKST
jgi:uncharacterized repeat protein (TIGR01451 family)